MEGDCEDEDRNTEEEGNDFGDSIVGNNADERLSLSQLVPCFAHTLQFCVKDGRKASSPISAVLCKTGCIVSHCQKSTLATKKAEELFGYPSFPQMALIRPKLLQTERKFQVALAG